MWRACDPFKFLLYLRVRNCKLVHLVSSPEERIYIQLSSFAASSWMLIHDKFDYLSFLHQLAGWKWEKFFSPRYGELRLWGDIHTRFVFSCVKISSEMWWYPAFIFMRFYISRSTSRLMMEKNTTTEGWNEWKRRKKNKKNSIHFQKVLHFICILQKARIFFRKIKFSPFHLCENK